jgi:rhamnulose-1-phosphate aldolase
MKEMFENPELKKIIDNIGLISGYLWKQGWAERNAGNISVDITKFMKHSRLSLNTYPMRALRTKFKELAGRYFLVKATGSRFRDIARYPEEGLLIVKIAEDLEGYQIIGKVDIHEKEPTSGFISHLMIHRLIRQKNMPQRVILHTHPTHVIALTHVKGFDNEDKLNKLFWAMHPEVKISLPNGVGFAPYRVPGSIDLAEASVAAFQEHRVIVWEMHGCTAIGRDVSEAFDHIDTVNKAAQIFFLCKSSGYEPKGLREEQLRELSNFFVDR